MYIKRLLILFIFILALGFQSNSHAIVMDAYFGWNFVGNDGAVVNVAELVKVGYSGGSGSSAFALPSFPRYGGMPDGPGLLANPTYTTVLGGDGETTRTVGATIPIDWGATAVGYPDILINVFSFDVPGLGIFTADFGPSASGWYQVGLIPPSPPGTDNELYSRLFPAQGDIYDALACTPGNPIRNATIIIDPTPGGDYLGRNMQVIFAAAAPPIPSPTSIMAFWIRIDWTNKYCQKERLNLYS